MKLSVAAAYLAAGDQTGQSIALLTAGLVGVALALGLLTVWYWRLTNPKRAAVATSTSTPDAATDVSEQPTELVERAVEPVAAPPQTPVDAVDNPLWEMLAEPLVESESADDDHLGLDDDQWQLLTQAVLETYMASDGE